jgi:hypothetical protein
MIQWRRTNLDLELVAKISAMLLQRGTRNCFATTCSFPILMEAKGDRPPGDLLPLRTQRPPVCDTEGAKPDKTDKRKA